MQRYSGVFCLIFLRCYFFAGANLTCVVDPKWENITSVKFDTVNEETYLVSDNIVHLFPDMDFWIWFKVPESLVRTPKSLRTYAKENLPIRKPRQIIQSYSEKFLATDCAWLAAIFYEEIFCNCTLPPEFRGIFAIHVDIVYGEPIEISGVFDLHVEGLNDTAPWPHFLPEDKAAVLKKSQELEKLAVIVDPTKISISEDCPTLEDPMTYFKLAESSENTSIFFCQPQTPAKSFIIDYEIRTRLAAVQVEFSHVSCWNSTRLFVFDTSETCFVEATLFLVYQQPSTWRAALPSPSTCDCEYHPAYERLYWRMGVFFEFHDHFCDARFVFEDKKKNLYGFVDYHFVALDSNRSTLIHSDEEPKSFGINNFKSNATATTKLIFCVLGELFLVYWIR